MENIKLYELEETYHSEKSSFEYPTVSYTKDTDKVWYKERPNYVEYVYQITEDHVGDTISLWSFYHKDQYAVKQVFINGVDVTSTLVASSGILRGYVFTEPGLYTVRLMIDKTRMRNAMSFLSTWQDELYSIDLSHWDMSEVINPSYLISDWTGPLEHIYFNNPTPKASTWEYMVAGNENVKSITFGNNIISKNINNMSYLFAYSPNLTSIDFGDNFDTSNVTDMNHMFYKCSGLTSIDLSNFNTSNVTDMTYMFYGCRGLTALTMPQDLSQVYAQGIMGSIFTNVPSNITIYHDGKCDNVWELLKADNPSLQTATFVPALNPKVEDLEYDWVTVTYDVTSTTSTTRCYNERSKVCKMEVDGEELEIPTSAYIFSTTGQHVVRLAIQKLNGYPMLYQPFDGCYQLTSVDFSEFDTSNVTNMSSMFRSCRSLTSVTFGDNFDTSKVTDMNHMFYQCSGLTSLDLSNFNTSNVTDMTYMFYGCSNLTSLDVSSFDTSKVTDMGSMFYNCSGLTSLDLSSFDTSKVTSMTYTFLGCGSLTNIIFSNNFGETLLYTNEMFGYPFANNAVIDFSPCKFKTCYGMFKGNYQTLDLSTLDTSQVLDMNFMFYDCIGLTSLDLSSFNTSKVLNMEGMFRGCGSLTSVTFGDNFDTSKVANMNYMFQNCSGLTSLDLSLFDTSKVYSMDSMFYKCSGLTSIDLSNFNTSNVTNMGSMFYYCKNLNLIIFGPQSDIFKIDSNYDMYNMFYGITTNGTLYYPQAYADAWNYLLVTNQKQSSFPSTWTAVAIDYENGETVPTV